MFQIDPVSGLVAIAALIYTIVQNAKTKKEINYLSGLVEGMRHQNDLTAQKMRNDARPDFDKPTIDKSGQELFTYIIKMQLQKNRCILYSVEIEASSGWTFFHEYDDKHLIAEEKFLSFVGTLITVHDNEDEYYKISLMVSDFFQNKYLIVIEGVGVNTPNAKLSFL